jgi:hypothetical protein
MIDFKYPLKAVGELALLYFGQDVMATHAVAGKKTWLNTKYKKEKLPQDALANIISTVFFKFINRICINRI